MWKAPGGEPAGRGLDITTALTVCMWLLSINPRETFFLYSVRKSSILKKKKKAEKQSGSTVPLKNKKDFHISIIG